LEPWRKISVGMARFYGVVSQKGQQPKAKDLKGSMTTLPVNSASVEESGPEFDFETPEVQVAAHFLTVKTRELRDSFMGYAVGVETGITQIQYDLVLSTLSRTLPAVYAAYDAYLVAVLATGAKPVLCAPSCPSCCSHYVTSVEPFELLFLDARIRTIPEYADKMVAMHESTQVYRAGYRKQDGEEAEDKALYRYFLKNKRCTFLTASGDCGVRDLRPMSCRMFFSYSDPRFCRGRRIATPANQNFHVGLPDEAEAFLSEASANLAGLRLSEHLFDGLLQVNETCGQFSSPAIS
jgi:Fe-S-cluster containining protein